MKSKGRMSLRKRKASAGAKPNLPQRPLAVGDLILDPTTRIVHCNGGESKLTPKECRLLGAFMENEGKVLSRKDLMKEVWDTDYMGDTRTLDVHIRYLRKKIEENPSDPSYILTVRGVGYRLELPD